MILSRKPELPTSLHAAWWAFMDCAEVIEGARRVLLAALPTGRVEPVPVAVGTDAMRHAIADARIWMPRWRVDDLAPVWQDCVQALDDAHDGLVEVERVAATTGELEELLASVQDIIEPLDAFADAERAWRRRWRLPRGRS